MTQPSDEVKRAIEAVGRERHLAFAVVTGSRAYGTEHPDSDWDVRGVYIAETEDTFRLQPPQETIERQDPDLVIHELRKFVKLATAANPNVLEMLSAPLVHETDLGSELRGARRLFYSRKALQTYGGYARAQFEKAKKGVGGSRGQAHFKREKFMLHLYRLMFQGLDLLQTGELTVRLDDEQREKIALWTSWDMDRAEAMFSALDFDMKLAAEESPLPEQPDYEAIDALLIRLRTEMLDFDTVRRALNTAPGEATSPS